jgi:hypothetical protein
VTVYDGRKYGAAVRDCSSKESVKKDYQKSGQTSKKDSEEVCKEDGREEVEITNQSCCKKTTGKKAVKNKKSKR